MPVKLLPTYGIESIQGVRAGTAQAFQDSLRIPRYAFRPLALGQERFRLFFEAPICVSRGGPGAP
jgi:hypothetical protein